MTGLEKILEQIENDAKEASRQLVLEAEEKAAKIFNETQALISEKEALLKKETELNNQNILERAKSSALLNSRKVLLSTKQSLINKTTELAKEKLCNLDSEQYFDIALKLAEKYNQDGEAYISFSKRDIDRLPQSFKDKLPKNIKISDKIADINGGFLLIYDGIDINCSFDALFAEKTEELQDISSSILFR